MISKFTNDLGFVRVKILAEQPLEIFAYNCTGYGWIKKEDISKDTILVALEDDWVGKRGWMFDKNDIKIIYEG